MGSEQNTLRWADFQNQIAANLQDLRDDDEFVDVTVACDENSQIQAHKLILSACSPYFKALLRKAGPNVTHPILIMPANTRYHDLVCLIDFMYHGEVTIPTEDVTAFLAMADQFKVKGLYHERPKQGPGQFRPTGSHGPPKQGPPRPPGPGGNMPPDLRGRLPPGISMMKSGGAPSPHKRPRLDVPHHPQQHHHNPHAGGGGSVHGSQHDDSVDEIQEIRDEEDSNDYYSNYGEEYEEGGWGGEGETPMQPVAQAPGSRGPHLMGLLCPNCRTMCQGVPALKEHMAICQGVPPPPSQPGTSAGHFQTVEDPQECHVCDKSFKSHRTLDNHMKKQHGISAPPKQANFMRGPRGRPKKPASALNMESVDEVAWGGPDAGYAHAQMAPQHKDLSARPVGQVAPAQRPLPPASLQPPKVGEVEGGSRINVGGPPLPEDVRRNQPSPRGGRGRGMPPGSGMGRGGPSSGPMPHGGGFPRPGSSGGMMAGNKAAGPPVSSAGPGGQGLGVGSGAGPVPGGSGGMGGPPGGGGGMGGPGGGGMGGPGTGVESHPPPNRPDLQKLGLKFGGQISITSTGNQGKRGGGQGGGGAGGGTDAQGVSITKLKGDMPVGSPVSIRDATNKGQQPGGPAGTSGRSAEQDAAGTIKDEPGQVKEEPKEFEGDGMEADEEERDPEGDFGEEEEEEEYGEGEFENDGLYQGDGDFEGMEGEMGEEGEFLEGGRTGMFQGQYAEGYPEIGGDYEEEEEEEG